MVSISETKITMGLVSLESCNTMLLESESFIDLLIKKS